MRQFDRYLMARRGMFGNPFRTKKTVVATYKKNGRRYSLHPTKGWRSERIKETVPVLDSSTIVFNTER